MRRIFLLIAATAALITAGSSVMVVESDEVAVVLRLGAVNRTATSGLAFRLPWPLESDERVRVTEVRRAEPGRQVLLTGDTNLVGVDIVAQYTISDPVAFVTAAASPEALVTAVVDAQVATEVSSMKVDALLTTGRASLEQQVLRSAQRSLDALAIGVRLDAVELRTLEPPAAVVAAFNDVSSARGDRDTMVLSAQSYASQHLPEVRGQTAQLQEEAKTAAAEQIAQARADVDRFEALRPSWRAAPEATRRTLVSEAAAAISPKVQVTPAGSSVVLP
jgi:membrane protease subunit HflK